MTKPAKNLFEVLHERGIREDILDRGTPPIPEDVKTWLGRLTLLYGVPFQYLVPDQRMLPPESLRFFYVDPLWVEALVDGALSIGRSDDVRLLLNKAMAGTYTKELIEEARSVRPRLQAGQNEPAPPLAKPPIKGSFAYSGFLLRSEIVAGWRGLAVIAYDQPRGREAGGALLTLRLERLARDMLFGLFEGHLCSLEITQPLENLHFESPGGSPVGRQRVLDVATCARSRVPAADNSADFAAALLATPVRYTFGIEG